MTEQTERKYVSDSKAYECFVGQITPQEFVKPFDGDVDAAIANLVGDGWCWDEPVPSWLKDAVGRYVAERLGEAE